ncbi:hypothetical protein [Mycobacterium sp. DL99]|uniref:hypothetical protein n=1 Tax=Mycobacterium sp. DL99 TaxID=2528957 RepID=UPI00108209C7|nr:hypothetical protein [Mycobacterium sp. DL99]
MSKTRLLPYRSLVSSNVSWGGWWLERNGLREPLPDLLPGWDYASTDAIGLSVEVTSSTVLEATGLEQIDLIEAVAVADCPAMLRRFVAQKRLSTDDTQTVELSIELPPGEAAQRLELSAFLLLAEDVIPKGRAASRRGSRLCVGPPRNILLEGDASRFPTEAVSFSALHLENAPWTISAVFDDVSDSFMGSVRLLVNEEHELGRALLAPPVEPQLEARLKLEVLRSLVALTSAQEISDDDDFPADSVGQVVDSMCKLFLNRSLHEAIQTYTRNPLKFDRLLFAGVGP